MSAAPTRCQQTKHDEESGVLAPESFQAMLQTWAMLHGFTCLEVYGHLDWMEPPDCDSCPLRPASPAPDLDRPGGHRPGSCSRSGWFWSVSSSGSDGSSPARCGARWTRRRTTWRAGSSIHAHPCSRRWPTSAPCWVTSRR
ncbi:MAG: WHG domain-containing protein [Geodermatophilaceae bacterium]|nr:WHG domain-containing protein [Geodermatophilaceae bacterium]